MEMGRTRRQSTGRPKWCDEPDPDFDPGARRHHRLSPSIRRGAREALSVWMSALPAVVVWRRAMQVVHPRCAGLDVHKRTVVACRLIPGPGAQALRAVRTFGTTTRELLALVGW